MELSFKQLASALHIYFLNRFLRSSLPTWHVILTWSTYMPYQHDLEAESDMTWRTAYVLPG